MFSLNKIRFRFKYRGTALYSFKIVIIFWSHYIITRMNFKNYTQDKEKTHSLVQNVTHTVAFAFDQS